MVRAISALLLVKSNAVPRVLPSQLHRSHSVRPDALTALPFSAFLGDPVGCYTPVTS